MSSARRRRLLTRMLFVLSLLLALAAGKSQAQTTVTFRSLEARICQSRSVLRGTITALARTVIVAPGQHSSDGTVWPDGIVEYKATVSVQEILTGQECRSVVLQRQTSAFDRRFDQWRDAHTSFLWFITGDAKPSDKETQNTAAIDSWDTLRLDPPVAAERTYYGAQDDPPVFCMDFTVISAPATILARARAFAKHRFRVSALHTFTIPRGVAEQCSPSGDANFLVVPVLPSLETTARHLVTAPQDFIPSRDGAKLDPLTRDMLRSAGVDALRHFRSSTNAQFLKALLSDKTVIQQTFDAGERKGTTVKQYPVRSQAYAILKDWGMDVPRPVLEEVVPGSGATSRRSGNSRTPDCPLVA